MKILKRNLIVLVLALLTTPAAYAYYNPSTGRWLSRDPMGEPGFQALQTASLPNSTLQSSGRWVNRDKASDASASLVISKSIISGRSRFYSVAGNEQPVSRLPVKQGTDFIDYQFCHNDPVDRFDLDGRVDVPPPVCQYHVLQGVVGIAAAGVDWVMWQRECNYLADHPGMDSYGATPGATALTIANMAIIAENCPQGGRVYMHVWFDGKCNCKRNYVIICNSCSPGA
jgi:hypothetical protein